MNTAKFLWSSALPLLFLISCKTTKIEGNSITIPKYSPVDAALYQSIVAHDAIFFDAYNNCDLVKQASIYSEDIEFYHDKGGLMTSKEKIIEGTEKNICGKVTRTLVEGSIEVYPIKDYGAVEIGYHKFYNNQEPEAISIPSKFIIMWQHTNDTWKITKVISLH
ncbi:nuclear transport factor 2 family protein [Cellulophaga sp. L1A9]|uniref:nuclear transport factor 2 family protein n=1 Tax=Cellulophaga sp. L1A9 TaxID=2686362 RepID=UPI00131B1EA8|nr:nuclear transport factor 2 family protein [Cellulophaga sp. L1A9]